VTDAIVLKRHLRANPGAIPAFESSSISAKQDRNLARLEHQMPKPEQHREADDENSEIAQEEYLRDYEAIQKAVQDEIAANKRRAEQDLPAAAQLEEITF
jgi:hypothetical protein